MQTSPFDLTGKVALITGGSRGIGLAIAKRYAEAGAQVVVASRKQAGVDAAVEEIRAQGGTVLGVAAHTGEDSAVTHLISQTIDTFGGIDILVNNAATNPHFGPIMTSEMGQWDKIFDVNVKGYFRMVQACVPHMQARGGGKIINMASVAGKAAQPMMGVYSVSKAAVLMLTEVLAAELAPLNIQVNAIAPGFVKTKFSGALWQNQQINDALVASIPQKRMAMPDELTGLALYLASAESSYITGETIVIDGGLLVSSPIR